MNKFKHKIRIVLLVSATFFIGDSAFAALPNASRASGRRSRSNQRNYREQRALPPLSTAPIERAQQKVSEAEKQYRRAESGELRMRSALHVDGLKDSRLLSALKKQQDAKLEHANSIGVVARRLNLDPNYLQAIKDKEVAKDHLESLRRNGASAQELSDAAKLATYGSQASKLWTNAQRNSSEFSRTAAKIGETNAEVAALQSQINGSLTTSPKILAARDARERARSALQQAQNEKAAAERSYQIAAYLRLQASASQNRSNNHSQGGKGRNKRVYW